MNKKVVILLVGSSLLACNFLFPQKVTSTPEPIVVPPSSVLQDAAPAGFTIVRLHPGDGDLQTMLSGEAQKATSLGQMPVVEFDEIGRASCRERV